MAVALRQVTLVNYKSIAGCKVRLTDVTILVGPNGAGKSNFLDALKLTAEGLQTTLEHAIRQRGGIKEVRRRSGGHPTHFTISLRLALPDGGNGSFAFRVGALPNGDFTIQQEQAVVAPREAAESFYTVEDGELIGASPDVISTAKIFGDRFYLTTLSAVPSFRGLFDELSRMCFYSINPAAIREPQPHDTGETLDREGRNIASVIRRLEQEDEKSLRRIEEFLRRVVPGIDGVEFRPLGPLETIEFRQRVAGARDPWRFYANSMSDGTLRSLGVLTALFHGTGRANRHIPVIAIEEPESTIHPGAAAVIMDAVFEASKRQQVLTTTHSPDLLDHPGIDSSNILNVDNHEGNTRIVPLDAAAREVLHARLFTPGELLRKNQLQGVGGEDEPVRNADLFEKAR